MIYVLNLSTGHLEERPDDGIFCRLLLRDNRYSVPVPAREHDGLVSHVMRYAALSRERQIEALNDLSRRDSPRLRALWLATFIDPPDFLLRLHLEAGELGPPSADREKVERALRRASQAVGYGSRGAGRTPRNISWK